MKNIDETVGGPASSGQATDTNIENTSETNLSQAQHQDAGVPRSSGYDVWEPPAYLKLIGQAMESCGAPGAVQAAAAAAQDLRNLEMTSVDSDAPQILKAHMHALNAVFARLIAQSMARPLKHAPLIANALRAQHQCVDTAEALRQMQECDLRRQRHGDNNARDQEQLRLLRIRMGFNSR